MQRRRSESNRRMEVLQTSALPLGYGAWTGKLSAYKDFRKPSCDQVTASRSSRWSMVALS
jgi:hypothetical protein